MNIIIEASGSDLSEDQFLLRVELVKSGLSSAVETRDWDVGCEPEQLSEFAPPAFEDGVAVVGVVGEVDAAEAVGSVGEILQDLVYGVINVVGGEDLEVVVDDLLPLAEIQLDAAVAKENPVQDGVRDSGATGALLTDLIWRG
jgi:hypothetical protein